MFKKTYESSLIPYRRPWVTKYPDGIPNGEGFESLYSPDLVTPPRIYGETLIGGLITAMFTRREDTATSGKTVSLLAWHSMIYYPGWEVLIYRFDTTTGEFIDRETVPWDNLAVAWSESIVQGFDGSLWITRGGAIRAMFELSPTMMISEQSYSADSFGRISCKLPVVDKARDIVIFPGEEVTNEIGVYQLSSGSLIRKISVSDDVKYICPVDNTRVFVLGENDVLNLVDYATGRILQTAICPRPYGVPITNICWDLTFRRLLVFSPTPDAVDGACTSRIAGYYPVPLAVDLTTPIPIVPPRSGKTIPVVTRLVGDSGEPIVGRTMASVSTEDARVKMPSGQTDGQGYVTTMVECLAPASTDLTITSTG